MSSKSCNSLGAVAVGEVISATKDFYHGLLVFVAWQLQQPSRGRWRLWSSLLGKTAHCNIPRNGIQGMLPANTFVTTGPTWITEWSLLCPVNLMVLNCALNKVTQTLEMRIKDLSHSFIVLCIGGNLVTVDRKENYILFFVIPWLKASRSNRSSRKVKKRMIF